MVEKNGLATPILKLILILSLCLTAFSTLSEKFVASAAYDEEASDKLLNSPRFADNRSQTGFFPDRVIVKFRTGIIQSDDQGSKISQADSSALNNLLARHHIRTIRPLFDKNVIPFLESSHTGFGVWGRSSAKVSLSSTELERIQILELPSGSNVMGSVAAIVADPIVEWVEPDYKAFSVGVPNDALYSEQWALEKINAPNAWDVTTGNPAVILALLDSGLDITHPDLSNRLWSNPGEIAGNGIDDDNNGFIDDVNGWNFVAGTNEISDDDGHGTKVAGVAAAETNNLLGISGMCWNCRLMVVKVMQGGGMLYYSDIARGLAYAAAKGAQVINLSLGGYSNSNMLREAIQAASLSTIIVAASGDDNSDAQFYPAAYPEVLAVGGTSVSDSRVAFSNYGDWVDLAAPAEDLMTTFVGGTYGLASGTSFAAPLVAGTAGLVWSQHPDWSPAMVRAQIINTARSIDDNGLGNSRIDASSAVTTRPHPALSIGEILINNDAYGRPTPGSAVQLKVTLNNKWADISSLSGQLSTEDTGIGFINSISEFGNISINEQTTSTPVFSFTISPSTGSNHAISFALHLTGTALSSVFTTTFPLTVTTRSTGQAVGGTIAVNTVWTSDKTYQVSSNVGIAPGVTLTIQAGTEIEFGGSYNINVGGALIANGTSSNPIRFVPANTGMTWGGIYFNNTSLDAQTDISGTYQSGNLMQWVRVEGASQGVRCDQATPYLAHLQTTIGGITCSLGDTSLWLTDSDVTGDMSITGLDNPELMGTWIRRSDMPTARRMLAVARSGDKIYAIGGSAPGSPNEIYYSTVEEFDSANNTWLRKADMPTPRRSLGAAAVNGKIYAIGGGSNLGSFSTVEEYDPDTNTWTTRASMLSARFAVGIVTGSNGKIYAIGGVPVGGVPILSNAVEEYDPVQNIWTTRANLPTPRGYSGVVATSNGKILVMGGSNATSKLAVVEEYDIASDTWIRRPDMPMACDLFGAAMASNGKIYTVGCAVSGGGVLPTVAEYDPVTFVWKIRTSISVSRYGLGVVAGSDGTIFAIGGSDPSSVVEQFIPPANIQQYNNHIFRNSFLGKLSTPNFTELVDNWTGKSLTTGKVSLVKSITTSDGNITVGDISVIQDSTVGGSIVSGATSVIQNNKVSAGVTGGAYGTILLNKIGVGSISAGYGSTVITNTIQRGGITLVDMSVARFNQVGLASTWCINASGSTQILENQLLNCTQGINLANGIAQYNLIAGTVITALQTSGGSVLNNNFTRNNGSTIVIKSGIPVIRNNNLQENFGGYDLINTTANMVNIQDNWWGTTDSSQIDQRVFDYYDDFTKGRLDYLPVLSEPVENIPLDRPYLNSILIEPATTIEPGTYTFDLEFSQPLNPRITPSVSFSRKVKLANLPIGITRLGVAAGKNGKIYAVGGLIDGSTNYELNSNYEYDPWSNQWQTRAPMSFNRISMGISTGNDGKIYVAGGYYNWASMAAFEAYDPNTDSWETLPDMPTERMELGLVTAANGKLYAVGGRSIHGGHTIASLSVVEEYDPELKLWRSRASMPTPRSNFGIVAASDGLIYVFGGDILVGTNQLANVSIIEVYNPETDTWTSKRNMPFSSGNTRAFVANSTIYVVCARCDSTTLTVVRSYNPQTEFWMVLPNSLTPRTEAGLAVDLNGIAYEIGGQRTTTTLGDYYRKEVEEVIPFIENNFYNGQWLSPTHYRTYYDFNALIPWGVYTATVTGSSEFLDQVIGNNRLHTFVVNYPRSSDFNHPLSPKVLACGGNDNSTLSAQWFKPADQKIEQFQYAIGSALGLADISSWVTTTLTSFSRQDLNLIPGQIYYVSVKAQNSSGFWSEPGVSNGVTAESGGCPQIKFIAQPTTGSVPLNVEFSMQTTSTITGQIWDFGDGITDTASAPSHIYTSGGTFTVTLDVFGPGGQTTIEKPNFVTATPDIAAPSGSVMINNGSIYANTTNVNITLSIADPSGLNGMHFSNDGINYTNWESNTLTKSWVLSSGDGNKTVFAQVRDNPGNIAIFTDTVILDSVSPTTTVTMIGQKGDNGWWLVPLSISLLAEDAGSGILATYYSVDNGSRQNYQGSFAVAGDGTHTLQFSSIDLAGFREVTKTIEIPIDTHRPTSTLRLIGTMGTNGWYRSNVQFILSASDDTAGIAQIRYRLDGASWQVYETTAAIDSNGKHSLEYQAIDKAGNVENIHSVTIQVDTTAPTTSISSSGTSGDQGWWQSPVQLTMSASDADSGVERSLYQENGQGWLSYLAPISLTTDGLHEIKYVSVDRASNQEITKTLLVPIDTQPPTTTLVLVGDLGIDGWYRTSVSVTMIGNDAMSGVSQQYYKLDEGNWGIFSAGFNISNDGEHTIAYYATDQAGNQGAVQSVTIRIDLSPPEAAVLPSTPYQTAEDFPISWSGFDIQSGLASYDIQVSQDDGEWIDWFTNVTSTTAIFKGFDGHRYSFRGRARDLVGNLSEYAGGYGDATTRIDTSRPEGEVLLNGGAIETISREIILVLFSNGAALMRFSEDGINFGNWEPFRSIRPYTLSEGDGNKGVFVQYQDEAGNLSSCSDQIVLNTTLSGENGVSINNDNAITEQVTVTLTLKAPPGTRQMMISNSSRFVGASWEPYTSNQSWILGYHPNVSVYQVYVKFRSVEGEISQTFDDLITLHLQTPPPPIDSISPSGSLSINIGAEQTSQPDVTLDVLAADNPGGTGVRWMYFREWKYDPITVQWITVNSSGWLPYSDTTSWTLSKGTGAKYIGAWFADAANNVSNPVIVESINLVLPGDVITQAQVTQYRQAFDPGQLVTVTLSVQNGDADLYIWRPNSQAAPDYWSNQADSSSEQIIFTAIEGEYLIEVHGYTSANFSISFGTQDIPLIVRSGGMEEIASASVNGSEKPLPTRPLVYTLPGERDVPVGQFNRQLFLPLLIRK
jgi:subtilisin family serine protease/PKD repeat protein/N-acetylneuraminic acid mutarotase